MKGSGQENRSGIVLVDKPQGVTSHDLVAAVRSTLGMRRVGHAGTLDPMATGLLIIGFGQATRLLKVVVGHDKTYLATIRLGQATTTDDAEGRMLPSGPDVRQAVKGLDRAAVERTIADRLTGDINQVPDSFSAIKVNGRRAYDLARQGKEVELAARPIHIARFEVLDYRTLVLPGKDMGGVDQQPETGEFDRSSSCEGALPAEAPGSPSGGLEVVDLDVVVTCSSGTYIRALARDLGDLLGTGGHLTSLRRTRVGRFDLEAPDLEDRLVTGQVSARTYTDRQGQTVSRNRVDLDQSSEEILRGSISLVDAARLIMPTIEVDGEEAAMLANGRFLKVGVEGATAAIARDETGPYLAAVLVPHGGQLSKPDVVFRRDSQR